MGIRLDYPTKPGRENGLSAEINDAQNLTNLGRLEKLVHIDDQLFWRHDIGDGKIVGNQEISKWFATPDKTTRIRIEIRAVGPVDPRAWSSAARTVVTAIKLAGPQ